MLWVKNDMINSGSGPWVHANKE